MNENKQKVLVTGAAGALGSLMAERLVEAGHVVAGLDCFTDYYDRELKEWNANAAEESGVEFFECNLAEDDLKDAVEDVHVVYHFAAQPGISASTPFEVYLRNNVIATQRLLEAVKGSGSIKLFINIATSSVYGANATENEEAEPKPNSYYGVTKLAAEQLVMAEYRQNNFPAVSIRPFSIYGERERPDKLYAKLIRAVLEDTPFPLYRGSREHVRSFTYVGDFIDGCMQILENKERVLGEIINLGTDQTHTTGEGIDIIEEILGKKAEFIESEPRGGDQLVTHANIEKARELLGYAPSTTLRQGLESEIAWMRDMLG